MSDRHAGATAPLFQRLLVDELAMLPEGARVLSVGEGRGRHVCDLALRFPRLRFVAFDLDRDAAEEIAARAGADRLANVRVLRADAVRLPFGTKAFAFSYARNVLPWLGDPVAHVRDRARVTRGPILYRDVVNWPFYPLLRRAQAATLRLRGKGRDADIVLRDARFSEGVARLRRHATWYRRWLRRFGLFSEVRLIGTQLLWWELDRPLPVIGLFGAMFSVRCVVRA